ncbi:MAG: response regulator transcription factor [Chitinophagales bacterium]|nr:response regulator transcription factor [Chitinophagales bacterium]
MQLTKATILLVEDDKNLASVIRDFLGLSGLNVTVCDDGKSALDKFINEKFDLCILDVMLPKMDGYALAEQIRQINQEVPILFLTSKSGKEDRIKGFKTGGDDFITKPFNIEELVLRIEVFLKRSKSAHSKEKLFRFGACVFDYLNYELTVKKKKLKLTEKESEVLKTLCSSMNQLVKRNDLLLRVWGSDDYFLGRSLDVFISKLRKYLSSDPQVEIENHHGVGFRLISRI